MLSLRRVPLAGAAAAFGTRRISDQRVPLDFASAESRQTPLQTLLAALKAVALKKRRVGESVSLSEVVQLQYLSRKVMETPVESWTNSQLFQVTTTALAVMKGIDARCGDHDAGDDTADGTIRSGFSREFLGHNVFGNGLTDDEGRFEALQMSHSTPVPWSSSVAEVCGHLLWCIRAPSAVFDHQAHTDPQQEERQMSSMMVEVLIELSKRQLNREDVAVVRSLLRHRWYQALCSTSKVDVKRKKSRSRSSEIERSDKGIGNRLHCYGWIIQAPVWKGADKTEMWLMLQRFKWMALRTDRLRRLNRSSYLRASGKVESSAPNPVVEVATQLLKSDFGWSGEWLNDDSFRRREHWTWLECQPPLEGAGSRRRDMLEDDTGGTKSFPRITIFLSGKGKEQVIRLAKMVYGGDLPLACSRTAEIDFEGLSAASSHWRPPLDQELAWALQGLRIMLQAIPLPSF